MKLRLCSVIFRKETKIQVNDFVKTKKPRDSLVLLELGSMESFGRPHLCGVVSEDIVDTRKVRNSIDKLEKMSVSERMDWVSENFPRSRIVKIELSKIHDRLKDIKENAEASVNIINAVELKWNK